jgi:hypothetical protein
MTIYRLPIVNLPGFCPDFGKGFYGTVGEEIAGGEDPEFPAIFLFRTGYQQNFCLIAAVHDLTVGINGPIAIEACKDDKSVLKILFC